MVNDNLSDFITRIRNGYMAHRVEMEVPLTKVTYQVAHVMVKRGYLSEAKKIDGKIRITLKYQGKQPAVTGLKRVSKPGARVYGGASELPRVRGGLGINILSTPKGIV